MPINSDSLIIEVSTLPQLNKIADSIILKKPDTLIKLDSIQIEVVKSPKAVPKKKKKISKQQQLQIKEKRKWENVLNQQSRDAIENYVKSFDGTNTYLVEAGKKLENFRIIKIDTILFDKSVNYTIEFKGTEDKAPSIQTANIKEISIKERNANFVIINTDYSFADTLSFLIEGSSWKRIPIYFSKPMVHSNVFQEENGNKFFNKYLIALALSILALWFFRYLFIDNKNTSAPETIVPKTQPKSSPTKEIIVERVDKKNNVIKPSYKPKETSCLIPLNEYWDDSVVRDCVFEKDFIEELQYFLFGTENINKVEKVELGGFILGNFEQNDSGFYNISCSKFVGIQSEKEDLYKMGFGSKAWIALEEVMHSDKHKNLALIGWFHTHPGHGIFLSKPDLNICNNIFPKSYQFAMVMDTIKSSSNEKYHVGLFTKKRNGQMNNIKEKKAGFVQWQEVVQKTLKA